MKEKFYINRWLSMLLCFIAMAATAQTVKIEGYTSTGETNGYPLFVVASTTITLSSSGGSFDCVLIDNKQIAYNNDSYWLSYDLNVASYADGQAHKIQLKRGSSNYGICYFNFDGFKDAVSGLFFGIIGENAIVAGADPDVETVDIPATITKDGITYNVTSIGNYAFRGQTKLTSVKIPESIVSIGDLAFYGCSGLTSVTIPQGVTSIGDSAFTGTGLTTLEFNAQNCTVCGSSDSPAFPSTITKLTIGNQVTAIPAYFLYNGSRIEKLTFPNSVASIGRYAFRNNSEIKSVVLPPQMTTVGSYAFSGCSSLEKNAYPSSISNPFYNGRSISYPSDGFIDEFAVIYDSDKTKIYYAPIGLEDMYSIPSSVTTICDYAFYKSIGLTTVTIPQGVTSIGNLAFAETGLTTLEFNAQNCNTCGSSNNPAFPSTISKLTIGNQVTAIPAYFLYNGSRIESLTIPNSVVKIGYSAFRNSNSNLKSLTLGAGLLSIDSYAFSDNSSSARYSIPKVFWLSNTPPSGYSGINGIVNYVANDEYSLNNQMKYQFLSSKFTVNGTTYVPVSPSERTCDVVDCVYSPEYENVVIADKVTNRGVEMNVKNLNQYAFFGNNYLKNLSLSNKGDLGDYSFSNCGLLESLNTTNDGNIGSHAFSGCSILQTAAVQNYGTIGMQAFYNLKKLATVTLGNNVTGILSSCFSGCSALKEIIIPDAVAELGESAFRGCSALEKVVIGKGVPSLPRYVFSGCSSLASLVIPENVMSVRDYAFSGCSSLGDVTIEDAEIKENLRQSFPDWTSTNHSDYSTSSKEYTFDVLPGDTLSFEYTVSSAQGRDYLIVKLDGTEILRKSGTESGKYQKVFDVDKQVRLYLAYSKNYSGNDGTDDTSVTNIVLKGGPNLVLGSNSNQPLFNDCPLDEVYIGRKLYYKTSSNYGYSPFYRNTSLRTVEITDAEDQIYDNEFYGCSNLKSLKIGNGVKTIGNWAFSGCSSLDYFSAGYMVESIGTEAFSDCTGLTKYYSYSAVPPVCGDQALDDINKWDCTLYVPDQSSDEYKAAPQWKEFFFVEEMAAVLVAELRLNESSVTLGAGETKQLTAEVLPTNATNKAVEWKSSDENVATVSETGLVTAKAEGTATITVKSRDGNAEASCTITVLSNSGVNDILVDGSGEVEVYNLNGLKVSESTENLAPGIYIVKQGAKAYKISVK